MAINDISLTAGMRSNLLSLQGTVDLLNRTQNRLSSGNKVNSAIDNPTSFFAAQSLNSRASVIDSLKDAMGQAVQTITAADKGIKAITSMIEQAKGIAQAALSAEPGTTAADVTVDGADQAAFAAGDVTIDVAALTQFSASTVALSIGSSALTAGTTIDIGGQTFTYTSGAGANNFETAQELADAITAVLSADGYAAANSSGTITISQEGTSLTVGSIDIGGLTAGQATVAIASAEVAGSTVTIVGGSTYTAGVDFTDGASLAAILTANGYGTSEAAGDLVTASISGETVLSTEFTSTVAAAITTGNAEVEATTVSVTIGGVATTFTAGEDFEIGGSTQATAQNLADAIAAADTTIDTATAAADGAITITYNTVASDEMNALAARYNTLRTQLDELAGDSGYKGKNLLGANDLVVKFEGTNLTVEGFDATTAATGLNISQAAWTTEASINASVTELDDALVTLRSESSKLSGNLSIITVRQDFSTNMINTLTAGADKLVLADANEEGANMLMLQTRQSLSTTALSLSAQAAQSVLKLFG